MYGAGGETGIGVTIGMIAAGIGVIATIIYITLLQKGVRSLQEISHILRSKDHRSNSKKKLKGN